MEKKQEYNIKFRFKFVFFLILIGGSCICAHAYTLTDKAAATNSLNELQQQRPGHRLIRGKVFDDNQDALIGVSIRLKGSDKVGTVTDIDGNYKIMIPNEGQQILIYSYIGMEESEATVGKDDIVNVQMLYSSIALDDVVIEAGYGLVQKRLEIVGSAFQVDSRQIKNLPQMRVEHMLEGLVPGVNVEFNSDSDANFRSRLNTRVRGDGSLSASSEPIWVIDGVRMYTGGKTNLIGGVSTTISPLSYLNPDDIESITVLKDASTAALYGADGGNGVILVKTKAAKMSDRAVVSASVKFGVTSINNSLKFKTLNGQQYRELAEESYLNQFGKTDPNLSFFPFKDLENNPYSKTNTDWSDLFFDTGTNTLVNMSYNGNSEKMKNYLSVSYYNYQGTLMGNNQERMTARANTEFKFHEKIKFRFRTSVSYNTNTVFSPGNDYFINLPIISPYNDDGTPRLWTQRVEKGVDGNPYPNNKKFLNSIAIRDENENKQNTFTSQTVALFDIDILEGLSFTPQFSLDYLNINERQYQAMSNWSGRNLDNKEVGYASRSSTKNAAWNVILRLNYQRSFGKHSVKALAGFDALSREGGSISASGDTFANDHIREVSMAVNRKGTSSRRLVRTASFLGLASYSYDSRYYLSANMRREGNSDFGEDVKWADFGSIGGSWNIHNERFFKISAINVLKLKASYGTAGNSRMGSVQAKGLYTYGDIYNQEAGATMSTIENRMLSWETVYITNVGLNLKFFNRFEIELEAYDRTTKNLLSDVGITLTSGNSSILSNFGELRNQGIEVNLESLNLNLKGFKWRTSINMSHNRNKIEKLYVDRLGSSNKVWREGQDKNTWSLVRWAGVNPRNGEPLWYDDKGNLTNVYSRNYAVPYKTSEPTLTGGITNSFTYKELSLNILMTYAIGGYSFGSFSRMVNSDGLNIMRDNQSVNQLDRWQKPGDLVTAPKPYWGYTTMSTLSSTRYLHNRTYLKLKNIALNYNTPKPFARKMGLSDLHLSFIVDNIGLWTPYDKKGWNSYRQSMKGYPEEIGVSLGINATF